MLIESVCQYCWGTLRAVESSSAMVSTCCALLKSLHDWLKIGDSKIMSCIVRISGESKSLEFLEGIRYMLNRV